ncbi:hypothetical protein T05_4465 [Trichinella murrelli]|uniref:Uncharacterized protein n=1 Tax=Trichinella murrelli TaxID=144512 RepID=A0A0V0T8Q8_9BILA|nr:hypothetical protein T05_4465 [Trichinella murrelli]
MKMLSEQNNFTSSMNSDISHFSLLKLRKTQCFTLAKTGNGESISDFIANFLSSVDTWFQLRRIAEDVASSIAPEATLLFVKHELASGYAVNRSHFCSASSSDNLSKLEFYAVLELQKMG